MSTSRPRIRQAPAETAESETQEPAASEAPVEQPGRRPYGKPVPELRGQIKPSLLGSPPGPP